MLRRSIARKRYPIITEVDVRAFLPKEVLAASQSEGERMTIKRIGYVACLIIGMSGKAMPAAAAEPATQSVTPSGHAVTPEELFKAVSPSVVRIISTDKKGQ